MDNILAIEKIKEQIESLENGEIIFVIGVALLVLYLLLTQTQRGIEVRKKFRILPKLIPVEDEYETDIKEPENLDGSSRQLKGEIIQNEHEILNTLLNQEGTDELSDFDEDDAVLLQEQDENIPLPNQNFSNISGQIKSISDDQEYCAACKKPVETEWKACPFCGEFLEEYED